MRLDRVVIGVDFSRPSLEAADWTARHFATDAELVLTHGIEIPRPPGFLEGLFQPTGEVLSTTREGAEARLRELASALPTRRVRSEVREGAPADVITDVATEIDADLTVAGEHGHHRGIWGMLGSTVQRLVRCCPTPVLLARELPAAAPRRILTPVEESEFTSSILAWARDLALDFDASVLALHVLDAAPFAQIASVSSDQKTQQVEEEYHRQALEWVERQLDSAGIEPEDARAAIVVGEARYEILAAQRRFGAELIVMGSHGAGAVERAFVGSITDATLRGAACPVLVIRSEACD